LKPIGRSYIDSLALSAVAEPVLVDFLLS